MKRLLFSLTLLICLGSVMVAQTTYALIAGVSAYQDSQMNLNNTTKDAKDLKRALDVLHVQSALLTSKYANYDNIASKLEKIVATAKENDKIMFFFSGHGAPGNFCTYDRLFPYSNLVSILSKAKAKEIYCFVDACHSGSVHETTTGNYDWAKNRNIIFCMGCKPEEFSYESGWVGNGFFTKSLLKGIRGKAARNGKITLRSLFDYIYKDVTAHTRQYDQVQHPMLIGPSTMHQNVLFVR
jgi:uncharacterized caspase-like protein